MRREVATKILEGMVDRLILKGKEKVLIEAERVLEEKIAEAKQAVLMADTSY